MLKEEYVNKKAKTKHYAYIYYKDGKPVYIVDNDSMCRLTKSYNEPNTDEIDEIIRNIKNDIGVYVNNYRKFKSYCKEYKEGDFYFTFKEATSLEGSPKVINGSFDCSGNKLTSLKGGPKTVKGDFVCSYNNITSLKNAPKIIHGDFDCCVNDIASLKGGPKVVNGSFGCSGNKLTSLEGGPEVIKGNFICFNNDIEKKELLRYLETTDIGGMICTDFGRPASKEEAIKELRGQITESYFDY